MRVIVAHTVMDEDTVRDKLMVGLNLNVISDIFGDFADGAHLREGNAVTGKAAYQFGVRRIGSVE